MRLFKWVVSFATWKYGVDSSTPVNGGAVMHNVVDEENQNLHVIFILFIIELSFIF